MKQEHDLSVRLRPWSEGDLPLLEKLMGDPQMMEFLGGPENAEQIARRHKRYVELPDSGKGQMFVIMVDAESEPVGSIGYWDEDWRGQPVYEIGWSVLRAFQGRGIATRATLAALEVIRAEAKHRFVHAFPTIPNAASNAICKNAGFSFVEEVDFERPKDHFVRCNDWQFDLLAGDQETINFR